MKSGECGICGSKDHRYKEHYKKTNNSVNARMAFEDNTNEDHDEIYLEIEGFDEPIHIDDPVLEGGDLEEGNEDNPEDHNTDTAKASQNTNGESFF